MLHLQPLKRRKKQRKETDHRTLLSEGPVNGLGDSEKTLNDKEPLSGAWGDRSRMAGVQGHLDHTAQTAQSIQTLPRDLAKMQTLTQQPGSECVSNKLPGDAPAAGPWTTH